MTNPSDVLTDRAWLRRTKPFPHIVARSIFTDTFYDTLEAEFSDILDRGLCEGQSPRRGMFARSIAGYDAYGVGFDEATGGAFSFFGSSSWHHLMSRLFDVKGTGYVNLGAHHHAIGSASGFIHNDFNPTWFPVNCSDQVAYPNPRLCSYKTGEGPLPATRKVEVVRAVAMIFFLANGNWVEGDGGETGLFDSPTVRQSDAYIRIPPENNSVLLFECTPRSYHAFLHNPGRARNSIIMWIHRSKTDALAHWPAESLEHWSR